MGDNHDLEKLWQESETEVVKRLKGCENLEGIIASMAGRLQTAFAEKPVELGCCDGRIAHHRMGGAGSFILVPNNELERFVEKIRAV